MLTISHTPIDPQSVAASIEHPADGAIVTFVGVVRNHAEGLKVRYLEYESYEEMAVEQLKVVVQEIEARWGISRVAISHRVGRLEIGDVAVVIAVGSPHRREAFEACHYAIDRVKETVPIWKKEFYEEADETWKDH